MTLKLKLSGINLGILFLQSIFNVRNPFCISVWLVWHQTRHILVNKQFDLFSLFWPSFCMKFDPINSKIFFGRKFNFYSTRQLIWYQTRHVLGHFNTGLILYAWPTLTLTFDLNSENFSWPHSVSGSPRSGLQLYQVSCFFPEMHGFAIFSQ